MSAVVVLFVDDEPAVLRSITRLLAASQLEILTAPGSEAALALLADQRVDVLVSDVEMPGMNGIELLARVRKDHPRVLRMLLTGSATLERAMRAINEGEVTRFFTKPFDATQFREAMEAVAERVRRLRREAAEDARASRRAALRAWLDERYPGLLEISRAPDGAVIVDVDALNEALDVAGVDAAARALGDG